MKPIIDPYGVEKISSVPHHSWSRVRGGMRAVLVECIFCVLIPMLIPEPAMAIRRHYGPHAGYLASPESEKQVSYVDVVPISPPPPVGQPLNERIFNDQLVREFRDQYEERFGRTEVERVYNSPNRFTYYNDLYGFKGTAQEMDLARQRYGDFVIRRLFEFHVDNYAKNDPQARPVWEAKERLKEIKVQVATVRFDLNYSIAGNTLDVKLVSPYFAFSRVRIQMDAGSVGPTAAQETTLSVGRDVTRTLSAELHYAVNDGLISFIQRKSISSALGLSLTQSTTTKSEGVSPRESKYLSGLVYLF